MNENIKRAQYNGDAFNFLSRARDVYQIYMQKKQNITVLDNSVDYYSRMYLKNPTYQNIAEQKRLINNKYEIMLQLQQDASEIANNLGRVAENALQALQISLKLNDSINIMLDSNILNSLCSFIDLIGHNSDITTLFKIYCRTGVIMFLLTDLDMKIAILNSMGIQGYNRLKSILNEIS